MSLRTVVAALALLPIALPAQRYTRVSAAAITHVTVVDVETGRLLPDHTVLIRGNRIMRVSPSQTTTLPGRPLVIDGRGKFLIPGLWDAHAHTLWPAGRDSLPYRRLLVAMGITATREPGSRVPLEAIHDFRRRIARGELLAPRIAVASGPLLEGAGVAVRNETFQRTVDSPERARHLVDSLKRAGADFVKLHAGLTREAARWVTDAARAAGLAAGGHLVPGGPDATLGGGIRLIDHTFPVGWCVQEEWRAQQAGRAPAIGAGRVLANQRTFAEAVAHEDRARCDAVRRQLADSGVAIVPTMVQALTWRALSNRGAALADRLRYVMPTDRWRWENDNAFGTVTPEQVALAERNLEDRMRHAYEAHRSGVRILAGTDAVPFPYTVPGFSLHDELALLERAGLSSLDALRAATIVPATVFGMRDSLGTVAPGKLADLVLLRANPLESIALVARIEAVFADGRFLDRRALDRLLFEQRRLAAGPPQQPE